MRRFSVLLCVCAFLCAAVCLCGCTGESTGDVAVTTAPASAPEEISLSVYCAGSLTKPFEELEKAFEAEHPNVDVLLKPGGSTSRVNAVVQNGETADVLASADYTLIPDMMVPDYADWYVTFAKNRMVLCYTDESKYADEVTEDNWYEILAKDDIKWAFSDPNQDPCGYRTPMVIKLAELNYGDEHIFDNLIGKNSKMTAKADAMGIWTIDTSDPEPSGTLTIRPKSVELVQMLESGGLDYAWEYRSVAVQNGLKFVELPEGIDLSSVKYADTYKTVKIQTVSTLVTGKPIVYGATVPSTAEYPETGILFIQMLIGSEGNSIMEAQGQPAIVPAGGFGAIPPLLSGSVEMMN